MYSHYSSTIFCIDCEPFTIGLNIACVLFLYTINTQSIHKVYTSYTQAQILNSKDYSSAFKLQAFHLHKNRHKPDVKRSLNHINNKLT